MPPRVVLVGPMGAGKTTVAGLLGKAWQLPVRDSDADIVASQGREISDIFVESGEDHFRALEVAAVEHEHPQPAHGGVAGHAGPCDAGPDHEQVPRRRAGPLALLADETLESADLPRSPGGRGDLFGERIGVIVAAIIAPGGGHL